MSDNDDQSNIEMILKALEYDQSLQAGSSSTHNMIYGDRDIVAERLVADYFGANSDPSKYSDYCLRRQYRTRRKLFLEIVEGPFEVNEVGFEKGYCLAEEIYPQWATFVK
ncbi:ALP1-like protein isoform X1 [Tanacetum coccineum]